MERIPVKSDISSRDSKEAAMARVLAREFSRARLALLGLIPDLPLWAMDVDPAFWSEHERMLLGGIGPQMSGVYMDQAGGLLDDYSFLGVDWGLVNQDAIDWARQYSYNLVRGITNTSRVNIQGAIRDYFEQQFTSGQLSDRLTRTFGPMRAEMIAVTEITRAAAEGERGVVAQLASQGITMRPIWQTNNDELVCPICGPKNGKEITDGQYPPAHPRCRCFVSHELVSNG